MSATGLPIFAIGSVAKGVARRASARNQGNRMKGQGNFLCDHDRKMTFSPFFLMWKPL